MESMEMREGNQPWSVPGAWAGMAAARPLPWIDVGAGEAETESSAADSRKRGPRPIDAARPASPGLAGLIHDARNMVMAIELYCDLLEAPGVLTEGCRHYAGELRWVSASSRRLLERLAGMEGAMRREQRNPARRVGPRLVYSAAAKPAMEPRELGGAFLPVSAPAEEESEKAPNLARPGRMQVFGGESVVSLADELKANQCLLTAVAGHGVTVGISMSGGDRPIEMTREDLARVLVNLTRNAAEAMPDGGHLQIALEESQDALRLSFSDTGSGLAPEVVERIFLPGYTTHISLDPEDVDGDAEESEASGWPLPHRGLGLAIVRSLVSSAGGSVWAGNREDGQGAVFTIEFPSIARRGGADDADGMK